MNSKSRWPTRSHWIQLDQDVSVAADFAHALHVLGASTIIVTRPNGNGAGTRPLFLSVQYMDTNRINTFGFNLEGIANLNAELPAMLFGAANIDLAEGDELPLPSSAQGVYWWYRVYAVQMPLFGTGGAYTQALAFRDRIKYS